MTGNRVQESDRVSRNTKNGTAIVTPERKSSIGTEHISIPGSAIGGNDI